MWGFIAVAIIVFWYSTGYQETAWLFAAALFALADVLSDIVKWLREMHDEKIREWLK